MRYPKRQNGQPYPILRSLSVKYLKSVMSLGLVCFIFGCTTFSSKTYVNVSNSTTHELPDEAYVAWTSSWRSDQKEEDEREYIVQKSLKKFFEAERGIATAKLPEELKKLNLADLAQRLHIESGHLVLLDFHEVSPNLAVYLSPLLWSTWNDVTVRVTVYNVTSREIEREELTQSIKGGELTLHGTDTLEQDVVRTLSSTFGS